MVNEQVSERRVSSSRIGPEIQDVRLDQWLSNRFTYHSRNAWQERIRSGEIRVNGQQPRPSTRLKEGDRVEFIPPDLPEPEVDRNFTIVYEDDDILLINKSGNLPCHPAGRFFRNTLWYEMRERYGDVHLVNRLDRETSGLVLAARSPKIASLLQTLFLEKEVEKRYLLLVFGEFPEQLHATGMLCDDPESPVRKKRKFIPSESAVSSAEGEWAETRFRLLSFDERISLVEARPTTGRLHQIRATACSLGYPLVGDKLYGPDPTCYIRFVESRLTEEDRNRLIMNRQALHAAGIRFLNPYSREPMQFEIPLPDDMINSHSSEPRRQN